MKKLIIAIIAVCIICATFCACGTTSDKDENMTSGEIIAEENAAGGAKTATDHITVDGLFVDDSYVVEEGSSLKLLYMFYTIKAVDTNLKIDSVYTSLHIGNNTYESEHIPNITKDMPSYIYTSYIQDVYVGESMKVVATFKVPAADLEAGKEITVEDTQMPDEELLVLSTDSIKHLQNTQEIAKIVDVEGYEADQKKREEADEATVATVKNLINGYEWSFYVNSTAYKIEFWDNNFMVTTAFGSNEGTYSVRNGYIYCTYPSTDYTVEIPYEITEEDIDLDLLAAFDVKES